MKPFIITHRGLEPSNPNFYYTESTFQAFVDQLQRGYGIEFDANFSEDEKIVVFHDAGLERITKGQDKRLFAEMTSDEIREIRFKAGDRICLLDELLKNIDRVTKSGVSPLHLSDKVISALHLKGKFQEKKHLDILLNYLKEAWQVLDLLMVFDVKIETAKYLKEKMPKLQLAPSVAHPYDIERYNKAVAGTLLNLEEAIVHKDLFAWAWLDEWDLANRNGGKKKLYTAEVFDTLKNNGIKIALVTPELHGTSPGLLGGEAHPDADKDRLLARIQEIINLRPDAICTDFPEEVKKMLI
ncbi:MAG: glycerophosphodiester phosphodiesterase family protein [Patescibacteria group bacterium]